MCSLHECLQTPSIMKNRSILSLCTFSNLGQINIFLNKLHLILFLEKSKFLKIFSKNIREIELKEVYVNKIYKNKSAYISTCKFQNYSYKEACSRLLQIYLFMGKRRYCHTADQQVLLPLPSKHECYQLNSSCTRDI